MRKPVFVVSDNVRTNLAVQPQRWLEVKLDLGRRQRLYCLCSENKGADQLCDAADLHLCFRICIKQVFS